MRLVRVAPIVLDLRRGGRRLVYVGVRHSFDPDDAMFEALRAKIRRVRPDVLLHEGGEPPTDGSLDARIREFGEAAFVRAVAAEHGIRARCHDLSLAQQAARLARVHGRDVVLLFMVLRQLGSWNASGSKAARRHTAELVHSVGRSLSWRAASMRHVRREYACQFGRPLAIERVTPRHTDPSRGDHLMNRIAREASQLRDEHMLRVIARALRTHECVLAVAGASHVAAQRRAVRKLFAGRSPA